MANFQHLSGAAFNGILSVSKGRYTEIALWGGGPNGETLVVAPNAVGTVEVVEYAGPERASDTRVFQVNGKSNGNVMVEARLGRGGPVWAYFQAVVKEQSADEVNLELVFDSTRNGNLIFNNPKDLINFNKIYRGEPVAGNHVRLSSELLALLAKLLKGGPLAVLSLYRYPKGGPHGRFLGKGQVLCDAVDIAGYRRMPVSLLSPSTAIQVVTQALANFPSGRFRIGFPRPVGGPNGFNAKQDVFFPVPDQATAQQCWDGTIAMGLDQMLQPARDAVRAAEVASHATFAAQFPDGLDHLHVGIDR